MTKEDILNMAIESGFFGDAVIAEADEFERFAALVEQHVLSRVNKPDWGNAPEWANWLAMDNDGEWYFYEALPESGAGEWVDDSDLKIVLAGNKYAFRQDWRETLEQRPE